MYDLTCRIPYFTHNDDDAVEPKSIYAHHKMIIHLERCASISTPISTFDIKSVLGTFIENFNEAYNSDQSLTEFLTSPQHYFNKLCDEFGIHYWMICLSRDGMFDNDNILPAYLIVQNEEDPWAWRAANFVKLIMELDKICVEYEKDQRSISAYDKLFTNLESTIYMNWPYEEDRKDLNEFLHRVDMNRPEVFNLIFKEHSIPYRFEKNGSNLYKFTRLYDLLKPFRR